MNAQETTYSAEDARWSPRVTVATVIERDGQFLCVEERVRGQLVLNQPAGHLEPNETLIEAAIRETLEETRYHIRPTALLGVYRWLAPSGRTFLRTTIIGEALQEDLDQVLDDGIERSLWLSRDEIAAESGRLRTPLVLKTIDDYLTRPHHSLDALLEL